MITYIYREYEITPENGGFTFVHPDYDGAPETYFSDTEQTKSSDNRCGWAETLIKAKTEIDEIEEENESETNNQ